MEINKIHNIDCLQGLQQMFPESVNCCVTSPPYYGLRDYGIPGTQWTEITYSPLAGLPEITIPAWEGCLGLEPTIEMYVGHMVQIFREVRRVLKKDGTLWLNLGDTYCSTAPGTKAPPIHIQGLSVEAAEARARYRPKNPDGLKPKDLMGIPWRVAFALQADGWYLRSDIVWSKPNCMPESTKDRPTKAHEYIFLLSVNKRYYYDSEKIKEPITESTIQRLSQDLENQKGSLRANGGTKTNGPMKAVIGKGNSKTFRGGGVYTNNQSFDNHANIERKSHGNMPNESMTRNKRSVWTVATEQFPEAHFATFPGKLIEPCILAGCPVGGTVLDPFMGSGTVAAKCIEIQRNYIGFELNPDYIEIAEDVRTNGVQIKMV